MSELREMIGTRIRAMRNAKGLTQQKLADIAGLDYRYIGALERGERNFSIDTLEKVLVALDVSLSELMLDMGTDSSIKQRALEEFMTGISNLNNDQITAIASINREIIKMNKLQ